jgi:hypothetical protein
MKFYYSQKKTTLTSYEIINFGFVAKNIIVQNANDSTEDIMFSWDGTNIHGHIESGEPLTLSGIDAGEIRVKSTSGGQTYRIWAWAS